MLELRLKALKENLEQLQAFVDELLDRYPCDSTQKTVLQICIEEVFVNIASYAYPSGTGEAQILAEVTEEDGLPVLTMTLIDQGIPFNPLNRADPDVTLSADERQIGGLGIYMVKDKMDEVTYTYRDGSNMLTIRKKLNRSGE